MVLIKKEKTKRNNNNKEAKYYKMLKAKHRISNHNRPRVSKGILQERVTTLDAIKQSPILLDITLSIIVKCCFDLIVVCDRVKKLNN